LKLTRAVRIGRSVKLLAALQEVRQCCVAMIMSVKPFIAACLILSLWITIISVYYTEMALTRRLWLGLDHESIPALRQYYGTIYLSSYSLFMAISGGTDWYELASLLPSLPDTALFTAYIAFSLLVLMNIITGVVISNVMKFAKDDELQCLLPSAEKVLNHIARPGHFREDISNCLNSSGLKVYVTGIKGEHAAANGEYSQMGEHEGHPFYIQKTTSFDVYVMYYDLQLRWCLGTAIDEPVAHRSIDTYSPPKGRWFGIQYGNDGYVKVIQCPLRQELKALLAIMEIDLSDVEAIFSLCELSKGAEVDMSSFLGMYVEARTPARRLEMMQLSNELEKSEHG